MRTSETLHQTQSVHTLQAGGLNGNLNLNVDFAQPVSNLSFFTIGDNSVNAAKIDVYTTTGSPITVDLIADGDYLTKELVDL
ncbi:hypothetical protein [Microcoleus sp. BROC3]|uniref:hypothetical protein n=1 Tax=Microcoleus sp. BROC3 TaxID=3055323 RepID=UPI002FCF5C92